MNKLKEAASAALDVIIHEMEHAKSSADRLTAAIAIIELAKHQNLFNPSWLGSPIRTELES